MKLRVTKSQLLVILSVYLSDILGKAAIVNREHIFGDDSFLNGVICADLQERMCEESSSFDLTSTDVAASISNVTRCVEYVSTMKEGMPMDVGKKGSSLDALLGTLTLWLPSNCPT